MQKRLYFLIATLMLMVSSVVAQVTTSGLSGRVSADGDDVIGATVEAVHTPSGTKYVAVTNEWYALWWTLRGDHKLHWL